MGDFFIDLCDQRWQFFGGKAVCGCRIVGARCGCQILDRACQALYLGDGVILVGIELAIGGRR
jgi:hypothetical protein